MPRVKRRKRPKESKHFAYTINNPIEGDVNWLPDQMHYMIVGKEVGPTGTPHLQCFVIMKKRFRVTAMKKFFPRAHIEIMEMTVKHNIRYCSKDDDFTEFGTLPLTQRKAVKRNLHEVWDTAYVNAKNGEFELIPKYMLIRCYAAFKRIHQDNPPLLVNLTTPKSRNVWIMGATGVGKSRWAREHYPDFYDKLPNKWWIGYKGQTSILIDDLGPKESEHMAWRMKRIADVYPFPAEDKGTGFMCRPDHILVTSQYSIEECFPDPRVAAALNRRFTILNLEHWSTRAPREQAIREAIEGGEKSIKDLSKVIEILSDGLVTPEKPKDKNKPVIIIEDDHLTLHSIQSEEAQIWDDLTTTEEFNSSDYDSFELKDSEEIDLEDPDYTEDIYEPNRAELAGISRHYDGENFEEQNRPSWQIDLDDWKPNATVEEITKYLKIRGMIREGKPDRYDIQRLWYQGYKDRALQAMSECKSIRRIIARREAHKAKNDNKENNDPTD